MLPAWSSDWPNNLQNHFPDQETYNNWVSYLIGIRGDPIEARKRLEWAKSNDVTLKGGPYGYPRAFTINPSADDLQLMGDLLEHTWGTRELSVLDPFAGGGSIPFEALRYGFTTIANDLNPVAAVILKATLDYPTRFGPALADDIKEWGGVWAKRVEEKLSPFFPKEPGENIFAYLWARTVACPTTGKPVPLSPNWWLSKPKTGTPIAVRVVAEPGMDMPQFDILKGPAARAADPDTGTIKSGAGRSPWTGETISGDYIKAEAQAGRMGQMLYAVAVKRPGGSDFRAPTTEDEAAVRAAERELMKRWLSWQLQGLTIDEEIPYGHRANERDIIVQYGVTKWSDMYSPRQLLSLTITLETMLALKKEILEQHNETQAEAIMLYLALAFDKCPNYNARFASWNAPRGVMRSVFDRHDFSFKWTFGEFDAAGNLIPWAVDQVTDAYKGVADLIAPSQRTLISQSIQKNSLDDRLAILLGSAGDMDGVANDSISNITVDPPYYNNVNYSELSDFFYVWLKRSASHLLPDFFQNALTNKDDEAVANPARFHDGRRGAKQKKEMAEQDYENKMTAAFREMHRVLRPDGALTVMFTHKKVEAWDTLASALIGAGFAIHASWPVHTESEHSLHQAKKNAAASTILLVCRKREQMRKGAGEKGSAPVWWEDIKERVRRVAREKAQEYLAMGIIGVDLTIATFGPTLAVISEQWPVLTSEIDPKTGDPKPLRPETALDLAREEVARLRKEGLLAGRAIEFDPFTDWYLLAWDIFKAEQFPFDEARKLAIALGVEMDDVMKRKRLVIKKGEYVVLQGPPERRKRGMVDPDAAIFEHHIDALHTAMLIYQEDGAGACDVFLQNRGLKRDTTFRAGLQALINAIPRTKVKGTFVRPEADVLDRMRLTFYADELIVPPEEEPVLAAAEQMGFEFEEEAIEEEEDE